MTPMQRFQPWLMPGMAFFTLSVGLLGLRLNLDRYAYPLMIVGSVLILWGFMVVIVIPSVIWAFGWRGRLFRRLGRKVRETRGLLLRDISTDQQEKWVAEVRDILFQHLGSECWEGVAIQHAGPSRVPMLKDTPNGRLDLQVRVVRLIQDSLRSDTVFTLFSHFEG